MEDTSERFEDVVQGVDVVLDAIGGETHVRSLGTLREGGALMGLMGLTPAGREPDRGITAIGILVGPSSGQLTGIAELVESGDLRPILGHVFPLAEAAQAHRQSETGRTRGKIVLEVRP